MLQAEAVSLEPYRSSSVVNFCCETTQLFANPLARGNARNSVGSAEQDPLRRGEWSGRQGATNPLRGSLSPASILACPLWFFSALHYQIILDKRSKSCRRINWRGDPHCCPVILQYIAYITLGLLSYKKKKNET